MFKEATETAREGRAKVLAAVLVLAAAMALLGFGIVFSNSFGAAKVASNARALHWTNATLGSTGIARAAVAQSVFFAFDERLGVSSTEAKDNAINEARSNLEPITPLLVSPDRASDAAILDRISRFVVLAGEIVDLADTGSPEDAEALRLDQLEPAFADIESSLKAEQAQLASLIAETGNSADRVSRVTQLAITFLIPGITLLVVWWILRRRLRERETEFQVRIEAEKVLSSAKDSFIAGLSHELRTPLTTIHGFSELLLENDYDADTTEMLTFINSGSADLSRMVADLLVAARIDADALTWQPQTINLEQEIRLILAPYQREGVGIRVSVPQLTAYADPVHFRQIVRNLLSNARRHGGEQIVVSARHAGGKVALVVADNGPGMSPELEERMFQRFMHRGRQALIAGSVGLGLAVSKELAMRMGGTITYRRLDGWTTFAAVFPDYQRSRQRPQSVASAEELVRT